ncbi:MAG: hypothetical protein Q9186_002725 [Xanthomendoza sp. 1 TL-2023]
MASPELIAPPISTPVHPERPQPSQTSPATPPMPEPVSTGSTLTDPATETRSRSSTRSGRFYLPEDTGIPPGRGRRLFSATTSGSNTPTSSRRSSGVAATISPAIPPLPAADQSPEKTNASQNVPSLPATLPPHANQTRTDDHTLNQLFSIPPGHEDRSKAYPGPPSPTAASPHRREWIIPQTSQAPNSTFFGAWYSRTLESRSSGSHGKDLVSGAVIIAAVPPGLRAAPRTTRVISRNRLDAITAASMTPATESYHDFASRMVQNYSARRPNMTPCIAVDCPLVGNRHSQGVYVHNDLFAPNPLPSVFGTSNPPPRVWRAILKGTRGRGTQDDAEMIAGFIRYHVVGARFSVVPDGNFIWGDEGVVREGEEAAAAVVKLPMKALPLRIKFNALPNIAVSVRADTLEEVGNRRVDGASGNRVGAVECSNAEKDAQGTVDPGMLLNIN